MWRTNRARQPGCLTFLIAEFATWCIFLIVRSNVEFRSDSTELLALFGAGMAGFLIALVIWRYGSTRNGPEKE